MAGSEVSDVTGAPEFSETPDLGAAARRRSKIYSGLRLFLYSAVVFAAGAGASWYYLGDRFMAGGGSEVPLVRADRGPVKVRPISPGGMEVPDRDKLVYDRMQGNGERPLVERLLPPPETPLPPPRRKPAKRLEAAAPAPKSAEELAAVAPAAGAATTAPAKDVAKPRARPAMPVHTGPSASPESAPATPTEEEVLAAVPPPAAPPPPALKTPAREVNMGPAYKVQLAAVRSLERAQGEWDRLRRKNSDLLGKLALSVTKADLGPKKGVFYRLRAGPLADQAAARALCANLTKRKVGCLVVRPGG